MGEGVRLMNDCDVPVWKKYTLTIEEASRYFRIGENKLRRLAEQNRLLNAKLNKKKNKENSQNKRKSLIKVNE